MSVVQLTRRLHGIVQTQLIFVAAQLRIADLLEDGGQSIGELARAAGVVESRLYRVLRALASVGIFVESSTGYFELTSLAEPLRSDFPGSIRDLALMMGSEWHVRGWANILRCVEADGSGFAAAFGEDLFSYLDTHQDAADVFDNAMTSTSRRQASAIHLAYDFSAARTIVDVGGGRGFLVAMLLKTHPGMRAILFERAQVAPAAARYIAGEGLCGRCEVVPGDFLESVPPGGDLYVLKYILHDWDDARAATILRNCAGRLNAEGRILVIDALVASNRPTFETMSSDIEMMVMLNAGRERTSSEFAELFGLAGLTLTRVIPTRSGLSILEGIPAR